MATNNEPLELSRTTARNSQNGYTQHKGNNPTHQKALSNI
jgi:hypothetical protein